MYKIGDKVETPLGIGKLVDVSQNNETKYKVAHGTRTTWYAHDEIKPYRTAHEKLLELGYEEKLYDTAVEYEVSNGVYKQYVQYSKVILIDTQQRDFTTYTFHKVSRGAIGELWVNSELARILTQYLEELEGE